jgi:carbonic anhydrase
MYRNVFVMWFLSVAACLVAAQSHGAQWKPVSIGPARSIYMDVDALDRHGDLVQAWDWQKFTSEQTAKSWEGKFHWVKSLSSYDCAQRTSAPMLKIYFDSEGAEVKRLHLEGLQFPAVVEPDSLREKLLNLACKPPEKIAAPASTAPSDGHGAAKSTKPAVAEKEESAAAAPLKVAMVAQPPKQEATPEMSVRSAPARRPQASQVKLRYVSRRDPAHCADPGAKYLTRTANSSLGESKQGAHKAGGGGSHWSYIGERGADRWGLLNPEYAACANGRQQSPIDISDGARLELEPITFYYPPSALRIIDNGHTVQINVDEGRYIQVGGKRFDLKQFHFHKPAEERVAGRSYDLVAHLVHKSAEGKIAMVAVLFELGHESPFLRRLWPHLPMEQGAEAILPEVRLELDKLLPENRGYFTYMGSLTTPPCTEGVLWMVMKQPVGISIEQITVFGRLYPMNARPIQSANGRLIKESF